MKGLLNRITLAVLIGLGSISAVSATIVNSTIISKDNVVLIKFHDIQSEIAYVKLIDEKGEQLWSEIVKGTTVFQKQFNLALVPDGMYKVIMTDGDLVHTKDVKKEINKVYVINSTTITILKPETLLKNKSFTVTYPAGVSKLVSVSFFAANGDLFFSDKVIYAESFKKSYNLKKLERGEYTVVVKTDQDTFYKSVSIR